MTDILTPLSLRITDDHVHHPFLGDFRRTGIVRVVKPGEYYLTSECVGIGLSMNGTVREFEILEPKARA